MYPKGYAPEMVILPPYQDQENEGNSKIAQAHTVF